VAPVPFVLVSIVVGALVGTIALLWAKYVSETNGRRDDAAKYAAALKEIIEKASVAAQASADARLADNKAHAASTIDMVEKVAEAINRMSDLVEDMIPEKERGQKQIPRRPGSIHDR
jgi:gas vesicle protein